MEFVFFIIIVFLIVVGIGIYGYNTKFESFSNFTGTLNSTVYGLQFRKVDPSVEKISDLTFNNTDVTNKSFYLNMENNNPLTISSGHTIFPSTSSNDSIHNGYLSVKDVTLNNVDITKNNDILYLNNCNNFKINESIECIPGTNADSKIVINGTITLNKDKINKIHQLANNNSTYDFKNVRTGTLNVGLNSNVIVTNNANINSTTLDKLSTDNIHLKKWTISSDASDLSFQKNSDSSTNVKFNKEGELTKNTNNLCINGTDCMTMNRIKSLKPAQNVKFMNSVLQNNVYLHTKLENAVRKIYYNTSYFNLQTSEDTTQMIGSCGVVHNNNKAYFWRLNLYSNTNPNSYVVIYKPWGQWRFEKANSSSSTGIVSHGDEILIYSNIGTPTSTESTTKRHYLYNHSADNIYTGSSKINAAVILTTDFRSSNKRKVATRWIIYSDKGSGYITNKSTIRLKCSTTNQYAPCDWTSYLNRWKDLRTTTAGIVTSYPPVRYPISASFSCTNPNSCSIRIASQSNVRVSSKSFDTIENLYVFGKKDGKMFKMVGVDSDGILVKNGASRYTRKISNISALTATIWKTATHAPNNYYYKVSNIIFSGPQTPIKTLYGNPPRGSTKRLNVCEGDCDSNSQCAPGLKCGQRGRGAKFATNATIPGCTRGGNPTWDYCYDPNPRKTFPIKSSYTTSDKTKAKNHFDRVVMSGNETRKSTNEAYPTCYLSSQKPNLKNNSVAKCSTSYISDIGVAETKEASHTEQWVISLA